MHAADASTGTGALFSSRSPAHERSGVTAAHVDAYRSAQLVRGWERGLLRFLMARVSGALAAGTISSGAGHWVLAGSQQGISRVSAGRAPVQRMPGHD